MLTYEKGIVFISRSDLYCNISYQIMALTNFKLFDFENKRDFFVYFYVNLRYLLSCKATTCIELITNGWDVYLFSQLKKIMHSYLFASSTHGYRQGTTYLIMSMKKYHFESPENIQNTAMSAFKGFLENDFQ
jgi:hypothetical protein